MPVKTNQLCLVCLMLAGTCLAQMKSLSSASNLQTHRQLPAQVKTIEQVRVTAQTLIPDLPYSPPFTLSRDGKWIAYNLADIPAGGGYNPLGRLHVQNVLGTSARMVSADILQPIPNDFSPDGQSLLVRGFGSGEGGKGENDATSPGIYRVQISTGASTRVTPPSLVCGEATFSPSGRRILFTGYKPGREISRARGKLPLGSNVQKPVIDEVYVANRDGSRLKRLCQGVELEWIPGGKNISFLRQTHNGRHLQMYLMDASGRDLHRFKMKDPLGMTKGFANFYAYGYFWLNTSTLLVECPITRVSYSSAVLWIVGSDGIVKQRLSLTKHVMGVVRGGHTLLAEDQEDQHAREWLVSLVPIQP
jgi:hypothetical protein